MKVPPLEQSASTSDGAVDLERFLRKLNELMYFGALTFAGSKVGTSETTSFV